MDAAFQSGFASALLDVLFNKVTDFITVELKKIMGSDAALGKLQTTILQAQKLLNQVDTFELQGNIKNVLQAKVDKLTELCYDTEDMMDDISLEIAKNHSSKFCSKPMLNAFWRSPRNWTKPHDIESLQLKLDAILDELRALVELTSQPESSTGRPISHRKPNLGVTLPLRNNDVEEIVGELISATCNSHGVSIIGIDGLGKTTVAQTIRNEARVVAHFAHVLWVDLAGCFDVELIMQRLDQLHIIGMSSEYEAAYESGENILIIFDNLLEVKLVDWDSFWSHLGIKGINGRKYRRIKFVITTFSTKVAKNTRTTSHYLKPLSVESCSKVIIATAQSHNQNLTEVHFRQARVLAKGCGGLPLVASIVGIFLAQYDADEVRDVMNEDLWDSVLFREEIFPSLKPCYSKLQSQLKRCLAYFSLFPHNYAFTIDDLVRLWIGEGFLREPECTLRLMQTAKDHFTDLLGMSIIRRSDQMTPSRMAKYELNPFGHKFAQLAASTTCTQLVQGMVAFNMTRHLSYTDTDLTLWSKLKKLERLRTILSLNNNSSINPIPPSTFKALTRLRVLSLSQTDVSKLPDSIKYLKQLRYLDISHTLIKTLPDALCKLHTLQFLKLVKRRGNLEYIPDAFQDLTNLIYIDWEISDIRNMGLPPNIGELCSLQTLPLFPVGNKIGYFITELKNMNHLQGTIRISNLEKVQNWVMAKEAKLCDKSSLKGLELEWTTSKDVPSVKDVLCCLKPHQNLKRLKIINYPGDEFPEWMLNSLPELEEMHLQNCSGIQVLPKVGCLPSLKTLVIEDMEGVLNVDHHFFGEGHFSKLESLTFKCMERVQEWTIEPESNAMPSLGALTFVDCPMLANVSSLDHLSSLVELKFECCEALKSLPNLPISLKSLTIIDSDLLSIRCRDGGDDWQKVDYITNVEIDYEKIPTFGYKSLSTPIDQQEEESSAKQQSVWRGYRILRDGTEEIIRWFGLRT